MCRNLLFVWAAVIAAVFSFGSIASSTARAGVLGASATAVVDGQQFDIPVTFDDGSQTYQFELNITTEGGDTVTGGGELDPDPDIAYGVAVTDFGAPSSFSFVFSVPLVTPLSPQIDVDASIAGGITDFTGDGAWINPSLADLDGDGFAEVQTADLDGGNMGVDVGPAALYGPGPPGANHTYQHSDGPRVGPGGGPYNTLSLSLSFGLSGGGDIFSVTGFAQALQGPRIPEPSSMALVLVGLGLAVAVWRRSRR